MLFPLCPPDTSGTLEIPPQHVGRGCSKSLLLGAAAREGLGSSNLPMLLQTHSSHIEAIGIPGASPPRAVPVDLGGVPRAVIISTVCVRSWAGSAAPFLGQQHHLPPGCAHGALWARSLPRHPSCNPAHCPATAGSVLPLSQPLGPAAKGSSLTEHPEVSLGNQQSKSCAAKASLKNPFIPACAWLETGIILHGKHEF